MKSDKNIVGVEGSKTNRAIVKQEITCFNPIYGIGSDG